MLKHVIFLNMIFFVDNNILSEGNDNECKIMFINLLSLEVRLFGKWTLAKEGCLLYAIVSIYHL